MAQNGETTRGGSNLVPAHHFDSMEQQFQSAKLGMCYFLAVEIMMLSVLFCLYAVYRNTYPEVIAYGSKMLEPNMGLASTAALLLSSLTVALAVRAVQLDRRRSLILFLVFTLLFAGTFVGVKSQEYSDVSHPSRLWGVQFYEVPEDVKESARAMLAAERERLESTNPDLATGKRVWEDTCESCHGAGGEGVNGKSQDIRGSELVRSQTGTDLAMFVKKGRKPLDPANTSGWDMPAMGGKARLTDMELTSVVLYMQAPRGLGLGEEQSGDDVVPADPEAIPSWVGSLAGDGPPGLAREEAGQNEALQNKPLHHMQDPDLPDNAHVFPGIYFSMTLVHGLHVLIGMLVMAWLLLRAVQGKFSSRYYTPVYLLGQFWHFVVIVWIFLFPLLYLA